MELIEILSALLIKASKESIPCKELLDVPGIELEYIEIEIEEIELKPIKEE